MFAHHNNSPHPYILFILQVLWEPELRPHRFLCAMIKAYLFSALDPPNRFTNASSNPGLGHKSTSCLELFGDKAIFHRTADARFLRITHMMAVYGGRIHHHCQPVRNITDFLYVEESLALLWRSAALFHESVVVNVRPHLAHPLRRQMWWLLPLRLGGFSPPNLDDKPEIWTGLRFEMIVQRFLWSEHAAGWSSVFQSPSKTTSSPNKRGWWHVL